MRAVLLTLFDLIGSKYRACCTSYQCFVKFCLRRGNVDKPESWILRRLILREYIQVNLMSVTGFYLLYETIFSEINLNVIFQVCFNLILICSTACIEHCVYIWFTYFLYFTIYKNINYILSIPKRLSSANEVFGKLTRAC